MINKENETMTTEEMMIAEENERIENYMESDGESDDYDECAARDFARFSRGMDMEHTEEAFAEFFDIVQDI